MSEGDPAPLQPSPSWRLGSAMVMTATGTLTKLFMNVTNSQSAYGLDRFLALLDSRKDEQQRSRGLITVSNHVCVIDDPLVWGTLPYRYHLNPSNHRWSLASYDIVFTNLFYSKFMYLGQVMPTHRLAHSPYGGLFQPTMTEAIRLLSAPKIFPPKTLPPAQLHTTPDIPDPFSSPTANMNPFYYSTNGADLFYRPSLPLSRRHSWIHIFPEGKIHQHPSHTMRYFKWGIARLILEADVCPDIVPLWIEGNQQIMAEDRQFPRFLPRVGKNTSVWFGDNVRDQFDGYRQRWRRLVEQARSRRKRQGLEPADEELGVLTDHDLMHGHEAVRLREECTMAIRREVLKVRKMTGLPDEDPKAGLVDTYREEGRKAKGAGEGQMDDGSLVGDA